MTALGERQVVVDCDVLQADGGTRTASICGGYLALHDALPRLVAAGQLAAHPLHSYCAAISVGIVGGVPVLDLPYVEDSRAEVDMNVVMLRPIGRRRGPLRRGPGHGRGAWRSRAASSTQLLALAELGLTEITDLQAEMVSVPPPPRPVSALRARLRVGQPGQGGRDRRRSSATSSSCCRARPACPTSSRTPTRWRATPA